MPFPIPCHSTAELWKACQVLGRSFFLWEQNCRIWSRRRDRGFIFYSDVSNRNLQSRGILPSCELGCSGGTTPVALSSWSGYERALFLGWMHWRGARASHPQSSLKKNNNSTKPKDCFRVCSISATATLYHLFLLWWFLFLLRRNATCCHTSSWPPAAGQRLLVMSRRDGLRTLLCSLAVGPGLEGSRTDQDFAIVLFSPINQSFTQRSSGFWHWVKQDN